MAKRVVRNKGLSAKSDRQFLETARLLAVEPDPKGLNLEGYRQLFAPAGQRTTGDISPVYASFSIENIREVRSVLEPATVFTVVRDPVDRFWSHLSMLCRYQTYGGVDYASREIAKRLFVDPVRSPQHFPTEIIDRWSDGLGPGRLKLFFFDDIVDDPEGTFREIVQLIGGDYRKRLPGPKPSYNRQGGTEKVEFSSEAKEWIRLSFQPELERCADLLGKVGESWLKRHR